MLIRIKGAVSGRTLVRAFEWNGAVHEGMLVLIPSNGLYQVVRITHGNMGQNFRKDATELWVERKAQADE